MDQFKKYLREHRNQLDVEVPPPPGTWQQKGLRKQSFISRGVKWIAAASIVLFASSILYWSLYKEVKHGKSANSIVRNDNDIKLRRPDSLKGEHSIAIRNSDETARQKGGLEKQEFKQNTAPRQPQISQKVGKRNKQQPSSLESLEINYATIIDYQLKRLERTPIYAESPDYFHVFKKQWYDLEKDEDRIRTDVGVYGLTDIVVEQFIQLYQNKIGLLKQLQTEIDKMNLRARNHPEVYNQSPTYLKM